MHTISKLPTISTHGNGKNIHIRVAAAKSEGNKWWETIDTGTHGINISSQRQSYISSAATIEKQECESHKMTQENVKIMANRYNNGAGQVLPKSTQDYCTRR